MGEYDDEEFEAEDANGQRSAASPDAEYDDEFVMDESSSEYESEGDLGPDPRNAANYVDHFPSRGADDDSQGYAADYASSDDDSICKAPHSMGLPPHLVDSDEDADGGQNYDPEFLAFMNA